MLRKRFRLFAVAVLAMAAATTSAYGETDYKEALKTAGWSVVPDFLDAATEDITIKFPKSMGGGELTFGGTIDADALAEKKFVFTTSDDKKLTWKKAFGMSFLNLNDVAMTITAAKKEFAITMAGTTSGALGKNKEFIIDIEVEKKKLKGFTLSAPNTSLAADKVPGLKNIPGAKTFAINGPTVSLESIGGQVEFMGSKVDAVAFHNGKSKDWTMAMALEKAISLGDLVGVKKGVVSKIALPRATVFVSKKGLNKEVKKLPLAVEQFLEAASYTSSNLKLEDGVTLASVFNPKAMPKEVKTVLKTIGLTNGLEISGAVGGMFGGKKSLDLKGSIETSGATGFSIIPPMPNTETGFFIRMDKNMDSTMGMTTSVQLKGGKKPMYFDVEYATETTKTGIEIFAAGAMRGNWKKALGIPGLTLKNPYMSVGMDTTGAYNMLLDGAIGIGKTDLRTSANMEIQPAIGFMPQAVAFYGHLEKLPLTDLLAQTASMAQIKVGSMNKVDLEFRNLEVAFMSPGAKLPDDVADKLSLDTAGMALNGELWFKGKNLGAIGGSASTGGMKIAGEVAPIVMGPVKLEEAYFDIEAKAKSSPSIAMEGSIELFKGFKEHAEIVVSPGKLLVSMETKLGGALKADLTAESKGKDFMFDALLDAEFNKAFIAVLKGQLKALGAADAEMDKARDDLDKAKKKMKDLDDNIAKKEEEAKKDYEKAVAALTAAQSKVNGLKSRIDELDRKISDRKGDIKKAKKKLNATKAAKKGVELAAFEVEKKAVQAAKAVAEKALDVAKKASVVTVAANPEVLALKAQKPAALLGIKVADQTLMGLQKANAGVESATKAVTDAAIKGAASGFEIEKIAAAGSFEGVISGGKRGTRPELKVHVRLKNKKHVIGTNLIPNIKFEKLAEAIAKELADEMLKVF